MNFEVPNSPSAQKGSDRSTRKPWIAKIEVKELFGKYTYDIDGFRGSYQVGEGTDRFIMLYGDNGVGKTTILSILFHLLSPHQGRGHRASVFEQSFQEIRVTFGSGEYVAARRDSGSKTGRYTLVVSIEPEHQESFEIDKREDGLIKPEGGESAANRMGQLLSQLNVNPIYVSEDRKYISDSVDDANTDIVKVDTRSFVKFRNNYDIVSNLWNESYIEPSGKYHKEEVRLAITRVNEWFQSKLVDDAQSGSANVDNIYLDLIERIVLESDGNQGNKVVFRRGDLLEGLSDIVDRYSQYVKYDLVRMPDLPRLLQVGRDGSEDRIDAAADVIKAYIESIKRRLDLLQELYDIIDVFVVNINDYWVDKSVSVSARSGVYIHSSDGSVLSPDQLSSGERNLILLFCNVLVARDSSTLFLVDEPELSLNVKWQRRLLRSLESLAAGSPLRFVLSTHSLEMVNAEKPSVRLLADARV